METGERTDSINMMSSETPFENQGGKEGHFLFLFVVLALSLICGVIALVVIFPPIKYIAAVIFVYCLFRYNRNSIIFWLKERWPKRQQGSDTRPD